MYGLLVVALPVATLVVAGLVLLWQKNLLLTTTLIWLLLSAIAYAILVYWPKQKTKRTAHHSAESQDQLAETANPQDSSDQSDAANKHDLDNLPRQLPTPSSWTKQDHEVWNHSCLSIEQQLKGNPDWQALPDLALTQLALISEHYHGTGKNAQFQFTVPELLLVVSETSRRYRQLVIEHVPFVDKFSIATGSTLLDQKDNIGAGFKWFSRIRRTVRLLNPASAVVGELRDLISNKIFSQASQAVQNDLKRLLLQEAAQVGIELYSGKLIVSDDELAMYRSQAAQADEQRRVEEAEPVRIVLLGQTSSGKSSLVNALTDVLQAEVDVLPVTKQLHAHELHMDEGHVASLIDTPGIDGTTNTLDLLVNAAMDADLLIWLAKATQPARAPDKQLQAAIQKRFDEQNEKLQPPVIMALTHIDQLSPKSQWSPPYDLQSDDAKAQSIVAAIHSAQSAIGLTDNTLAVPVYVGQAHARYNVDALASQIMMLSDTLMNVQLNRRRLELGSSAYSWRERWSQTTKLGRVIGQSLTSRFKT